MSQMILKKVFPLEIRFFNLKAGDKLDIRQAITPAPNYVMGAPIDFTEVDGKWVGPDNRKSYAPQKEMLISNCAHVITEGEVKQTYNGKVYGFKKGEGGWYYMPRNLLDVIMTCDVDSKFVAVDFMTGDIVNREVYNLKAGESVNIDNNIEGNGMRYIVVASGKVIANDTHNFNEGEAVKCKNPIKFTAVSDTILLLNDCYLRKSFIKNQ